MNEFLPQGMFYCFAGLTILCALGVVLQNNPVRCVLFLVATFLTSAVLWILLQAEFLALILVLVYVGAVMTLFLFVVMMLNIDTESLKKAYIRHLPFGLIFIAVLVSVLLKILPASFHHAIEPSVAAKQLASQTYPAVAPEPVSDTMALGLVLYTDYVLAFELAAVLLLVAIISAITLVHRTRQRSKKQDVVKQIMTRREERVSLVKMKSEQQ